MENEGLIKVKDFWGNDEIKTIFREWQLEAWFNAQLPGEAGSQFYQELQRRKIDRQRGPDQVRWGHITTGTFNIKEATILASGNHSM